MGLFSKLKDRLPKEKSKDELDKHYDNMKLEKHDLLAMLIAAFITIVPFVLIILGVIYGVIWFVFLR